MILVYVWLGYFFFMLFLFGITAGSFLNVCIARLPQGRSVLWPGSCCGCCRTPIRLRDNLPLVSYWALGGRCRACGVPFSMRYFWIELLTGLGFVGLYLAEVVFNSHRMETMRDSMWHLANVSFPPFSTSLFLYHVLLLGLVIVAGCCILEHRRVPRSVTVVAAALGLAGAVLFSWPWPESPSQVVRQSRTPGQETLLPAPLLGIRPMPADEPWDQDAETPAQGVYPWPVWGPLPAWLPPGSWQLGLATGLGGMLAGLLLVPLGRLCFNAGLGGHGVTSGEADLALFAGAFLGWQPVVAACFLALAVSVLTRALARKGWVPFGTWLALALPPTWVGWAWIGPPLQRVWFNGLLLPALGIACCPVLALLGFLLRLVGVPPLPPEPPPPPAVAPEPSPRVEAPVPDVETLLPSLPDCPGTGGASTPDVIPPA